jgi:phospholipid transport system substrate-binding protein
MLGRKKYLNFALIALLICLGSNSVAAAETPKQQLQATVERIMEVFKTFRGAEDYPKNQGRLRQILSVRFDFTEMARRSLGTQWNNLQAKQKQAEFVSAFTQFVEASYLGQMGSYRGEKIVYGRERLENKLAEVETQVVGGEGAPLDVRYLLHLVAKEWRVYDIVIDQVSVVDNYRSQFNRILQTASLDELLKKLREKGSAQKS